MRWEPQKRWFMVKDKLQVIFEEDADGRVLVCDHITRRNYFVNRKRLRTVEAELTKNGFEKIAP